VASLLDKYRATQRRLRILFAQYTSELCPICPEPCCRKPTKVREFDVILANAIGYSLPSANQAASEFVEASMDILSGRKQEYVEADPCDYLGEHGCLFPDDLRPYDCVAFICPHLKKAMSSQEMRQVRRLLRRLSLHYNALIDTSLRRLR